MIVLNTGEIAVLSALLDNVPTPAVDPGDDPFVLSAVRSLGTMRAKIGAFEDMVGDFTPKQEPA